MEASVRIRPVKHKDLKALAKIYIKSYGIYGNLERWNTSSSLKLMNYFYDRQRNLFFVAEINSKIIGSFVAIVKPWWDGNHLFDGELFVDPAFQKKGVAKTLLKTGLQKAVKKYNAKVWEATTFKSGFPLSWYVHIGLAESSDYTFISGNIKDILKKLDD